MTRRARRTSAPWPDPRRTAVCLAALASLGAACAPFPLPDRVEPPQVGLAAWPDLARGGTSQRDGRRDAALILSVEDYDHLPDRPGAHATAGAWVRYLREVRGLRRGRVHWLRDRDVSRAEILQHLGRATFAIGRDARLWVIFVGHTGSHERMPHGLLLGPDAEGRAQDLRTQLRWAELLTRAGYGAHQELVVALDGCLPGASGPDAWRSGAPARPLPNLRRRPLDLPYFPRNPTDPSSMASMAMETAAWNQYDAELRRREPTDALIFTSGLGERCVESLPGTQFPALSYLLLGALRGWGDADGRITGSEALRQVDALLRAAGARARVEAHGADLVLTRAASDRGPDPAGLRPPPGLVPVPSDMPEEAATFSLDPMRRIPRGHFMFGCRRFGDPECEPDERPPRRIYLNAYALDTHEVAWRDYAGCVAAGGCSAVEVAACYVWTGEEFVRGAPLPPAFLEPDHPVVCATWAQASEYCAWMDKRLPTEAEWERAARGPDARAQYPWGDEPATCERAHSGACGETTAPVGAHPKGTSPEGLHDLAGNAAEWVADWYDRSALYNAYRNNPAGPARGEVRVVRGGSFYEGPGNLRNSYRYGLNPRSGFGFVGFRCAR